MRDVRLPFRQSGSAAEMSPWQMKTPDGLVDLPEDHASWDPTVDIEVSRRITLDGTRLRDECALVNDGRVRLLAGWHSENGRSRMFPWRHDLKLPSRFEGTVELKIPGALVATSVELLIGAVLVAGERNQPLVAATVPGSWLWRDVQELRLEHTRGRFPMEWTDFKRSGLPAEAPWYLDWPAQDWDAPLLGALRLRLNATNRVMQNIMDLPEADAKRQIAVRSAILDVAKQLVITALDSDEFIENHASCPEGSVGFCVRLLIGMAFQQESLKSIRSLLRDRAGDFHMRFQSAIVPFDKFTE